MILLPGQLCPKSHPHVCGKGRKCTFEPWQPDDRSGSDCNGDLHTDAKSCCFYENIDCGDEAAQTCTKNYEYGICEKVTSATCVILASLLNRSSLSEHAPVSLSIWPIVRKVALEAALRQRDRL